MQKVLSAASRELKKDSNHSGSLGVGLTLANLENDHEFIGKEYISFGISYESLCLKWTISY